MLDSESVERLWEVCDDLGFDVSTDDVQVMWNLYCDEHHIVDRGELPLSPSELFSIAEESYDLWTETACVS